MIRFLLHHSSQSYTMARQKQTKPTQRAASSEFVNMLPGDPPAQSKQQNGGAKATVASAAATDDKEHGVADTPGLLQLAICVLGIYASLYVQQA